MEKTTGYDMQDLAMGLQNLSAICKHFLILESSSYCQSLMMT
jgi:hypothetical protein